MKTKYLTNKTPLAAAIGGILATSSPVVLAQDNGADTLEEIVVTATRRETSVLDVPYNISAVSGRELAEAQIFENADLMRNVAGVGVVDQGRRNQGVINQIMIRGLNIDGAALGDYPLNTVPTVSTYVNDTPIYANFMLKDVNRVEVLRGPQGTLYGSGSLGGTVRYIMNSPDPSAFDASVFTWVSQTDGSEGTNYGGDFMLNMPLSETAAIRITGGTLQGAGVVDLPNAYVLDANGLPVAPNGVGDPAAEYERIEDADEADIKYGRVSIALAPNDQFDALFSYQFQEDDIGGRRQVTVGNDGWGEPYGEYELGSIQREPSSREVDLVSLEMNMDLGFATLTSSTSSYDHEGDSTSENTGFGAQLGWLAGSYYNYPRPMWSAFREYSDKAFVQELRLVSSAEDATIDWTVGGFYRDQELYAWQSNELVGFERWADEWWFAGLAGGEDLIVRDRDFGYIRDETFEDIGLFGEVTWHASEDLHLTFGARWFENEFKNDTFMEYGVWDPGIFQPQNEAFYTGKEDDVLFKVNAAYNLSESQTVYGTISEGYRRGGANAVPLGGNFAEDPGWQQYGPDSVVNYEIGWKGSIDNLNFSTAIFMVDWDDVQLNTATTNWAFYAAANGDTARTQGLEVELDGYVGDNLRYNIGYAYVDGKITSDAFAPVDPTYVLAPDGAPMVGTAEHTLNAAVQYRHDLESGMSWTTRVNGYYQSETENAFGDGGRAPGTFTATFDGFTMFNLVTWISSENWHASFYVRNLTNEEGTTGQFSELYMGSSPAQNYFGNGSKQFIALPRTIGAAFTYEF